MIDFLKLLLALVQTLFRSREAVAAENLVLQQQLYVLCRH